MTLLARIQVHTQQICGLAWSTDGEQFATGGNDNLCCLFSVEKVLESKAEQDDVKIETEPISRSQSTTPETVEELPPSPLPRELGERVQAALNPRATEFTPMYSGATTYMPDMPWISDPEALPQTSYVTRVASWSRNSDDFIPPVLPPSPPSPPVKTWRTSATVQMWQHLAAVKAIAFCPWRPHLIATGGGSNDKMIHFFHTTSGAVLATISVSAQVTSLNWSTTRREIAATFGYAQPDHAIRIAVFSWPDCKMVGSVKWDGEHRALFAVTYPGASGLRLPLGAASVTDAPEPRRASIFDDASHEEGRPEPSRSPRRRNRRRSKEMGEGCLIVAASDKSVKFHEVWGTSRGRSIVAAGPGALGGSDIIEMAEGIDKDGDIIR